MRNALCFIIGWLLLGAVTVQGRDMPAEPVAEPAVQAETEGAAEPLTADEAATGENARERFLSGYALFQAGKYREACRVLYDGFSRMTPDDADYEWTAFFFGISLGKCGFSHAATDILTHLVTRKPNTKIVSYSLEVLEDISRRGPFDRDLLVDTALCDQSYDFVQGDIADFVNYYQGEYNWDHGLFSWGDIHFGRIRTDSHYHSKVLFQKGLRALYADRTDTAIGFFRKVLAAPGASAVLKDDARKTLARLYYEIGRFADADFLYQQIEMSILDQSRNLLERAWVHYRMGNPERSMGLLYSFEAPSFRNAFTPEFFILKAFIYKDVCHYEEALGVIDQFADRYGDALKQVYDRRPPEDNDALLLVILSRPRVKRLWQFLTLLQDEQAASAKIGDEKLGDYLERVYELKRAEYRRKFRLAVNDEYETMADALLRFEEEAHLMEYEIGLDMYQRVSEAHYGRRSDGRPEKEDRSAVYRFQGEFWNDELDQYRVTLPDKCQEAEEWDIFFK